MDVLQPNTRVLFVAQDANSLKFERNVNDFTLTGRRLLQHPVFKNYPGGGAVVLQILFKLKITTLLAARNKRLKFMKVRLERKVMTSSKHNGNWREMEILVKLGDITIKICWRPIAMLRAIKVLNGDFVCLHIYPAMNILLVRVVD